MIENLSAESHMELCEKYGPNDVYWTEIWPHGYLLTVSTQDTAYVHQWLKENLPDGSFTWSSHAHEFSKISKTLGMPYRFSFNVRDADCLMLIKLGLLQ